MEILRSVVRRQTFELLLEVIGDSSADRDTILRWSQTFEVQHNTEDKEFSGKPTTSTDNTSAFIIARILVEDRRMTYDVIAVESRIP
jgi:hypothetical protein